MEQTPTTFPSSLSLLLGMIDRPRSTLVAVLARPRWKWLLPLLICLAASALLLAVSLEDLSQQAVQQQAAAMQALDAQMQAMSAAEQEQMRQQMAALTGPLFLGLTTFVTGALGLLFGWLLGAGILSLGLAVGGAAVSYASLLTALSWTWLPFALRDLLSAGWAVVTGAVRVNPGLSYFVATGDRVADAADPLWLLAGQVDLFWLWHLVLIYALLKAARPRGSAWGLTLVYAVIYLVIRVAPAALLASLSTGLL